MAGYNRTRYVEQLLEKTETLPPSFTVHLHPEYWVLNNGSKFLYHNQIASLLDDIRAHRIPVDFLELFDSARVPFYDGCMVVELLDYRPLRSKEPVLKVPERTRVILHPNPETLWADICTLNQSHGGKWTDVDALEVEAKILLSTSQPLCLDPNPHLTRIVNHVLRVSTPSMPPSLKRKASVMESEEDGPEKARRERLLGFMAPRDNRQHAPSYRLLDSILANRANAEVAKATGVVQPGNQYMNAPSQPAQSQTPQIKTSPTPPTPAPLSAHSPVENGDTKIKKFVDTPQAFNVAFHPNGSHTPIPAQPTHQFVNQHPPMAPPVANMQPQVYANLQAAKDAANNNRAPTPAQQQHYIRQYQLQQQNHQNQQQNQQSPPQPPQSQLPHQQSQPQHSQQNQTHTSPPPPHQQLTAQQFQQAQQLQQQRYTQSPKPQAQQGSSVLPTQQHPNANLQQFTGATPNFQAAIPNPQFLQPPPPGARSGQKPPQQGQQQHPQNQQQLLQQFNLPPNASTAQIAHAQQFYLQQQRMHMVAQQKNAATTAAAANVNGGGRTTPQMQQSPTQALQHAQAQGIMAANTPSPARSSPIVNHQNLAAANQQSRVSASPRMLPNGQIPIQQQMSGQQQGVSVGVQGQGQGQQQHGQQAGQGGMQLPSQRMGFTPQFNSSQLRPPVHGNPQMVQGGANTTNANSNVNGTPTMASAASPRVTGGRPITPALIIGPDGKPQPMPMRRPTPLEQHQMANTQAQQKQQQTPQVQPQRLPSPTHSQGHGQGQPQQASTPVQQPAQIPNQQQMGAYTQVYGYPQFQLTQPPFWRVAATQPGMAQQQGQAQAQPNPHQMQQLMAQQLAQQAVQQGGQAIVGGQGQVGQIGQGQGQQGGMSFTPQQMQLLAAKKQHQLQQIAQAQAQGVVQGGQAHVQGGVYGGQQHQFTQQQMLAMKSKMAQAQAAQAQGGQIPTPAQMHHLQQMQMQMAKQAQAAQQAVQQAHVQAQAQAQVQAQAASNIQAQAQQGGQQMQMQMQMGAKPPVGGVGKGKAGAKKSVAGKKGPTGR